MLHPIVRLCSSVSFGLVVALMAAPGMAQNNPNQPQQGMPNFQGQPGQKQEKLNLTGTLTAAQAPLIKVKPEAGNQEWTIRVESKPDEIIVRGEAEKDWVRPGMFVMFTATLDKKSFGQEPVTEVSIFTPTPQIEMGVTDASLPTLTEEGGEAEESEAKQDDAETSKYTVVGRLGGVARDGKWSVTAGRDKVTVEVAEDAKISVELPDPRLIRIGDTVKGTVMYYNEGTGIMKGQVEVEAAQPFAAPEDPKKSRRSRRERNDAPIKPEEAKSIFDM